MQRSLLEQQTLKAEVADVVFANPDTGFSVVKATSPDEPGRFSVVGVLGNPNPGEALELTGQWKEHPRFGRQFEATDCRVAYPATVGGILRYLSSGLIKGVGKGMAARMVDLFGEEVLDILDTEPRRLLEVPGIGEKTLEKITASWESQREVRSLMLFLQTFGVPTTFAARIFKLWGNQAESRLRENPYELAYEIRGIGFKRADEMARKLGLAPDAPQRLEAALVWTLFGAADQGHLYLPRETLLTRAAETLSGPWGVPDLLDLEMALARLDEVKRVRAEDVTPESPSSGETGTTGVYLYHFYKYETETARRLAALLDHPASGAGPDEVAAMLPGVEAASGLELSGEQRQAVLGAGTHKVFIITGGPGTGKTTITRTLVGVLDKLELRTLLCAPTGRAAKRLAEATGKDASTIHRLLQYAPGEGFHYCEDNKLPAQAVVVDEASMLDASLVLHLLRALPLGCRLVLVGDVNQLPSVGPGNVLDDLLESGVLPRAILTHIYRQARESGIVVNAHRVNRGEYPLQPELPAPECDFFLVRQDDPVRVREMISQLVCERIPEAYGLDPVRDIQVITPMHKGEAGTRALNQELQARLNPHGTEIVRGFQRLRLGDRVLQLKNNYDKEVYNGDLGWIADVDAVNQELVVEFDHASVAYELCEIDELGLAYAVSVHKSQGSEYPAVVMCLLTQHYVLLQRNLLYTGLTRARNLAVIIGAERAVRLALANDRSDRRHTHLRRRLALAVGGRAQVLPDGPNSGILEG